VSPDEEEAYAEYQIATRALRDAELVLRRAQDRYKAALAELNKRIAPLPEGG